jgi:hypothetical protein
MSQLTLKPLAESSEMLGYVEFLAIGQLDSVVFIEV